MGLGDGPRGSASRLRPPFNSAARCHWALLSSIGPQGRHRKCGPASRQTLETRAPMADLGGSATRTADGHWPPGRPFSFSRGAFQCSRRAPRRCPVSKLSKGDSKWRGPAEAGRGRQRPEGRGQGTEGGQGAGKRRARPGPGPWFRTLGETRGPRKAGRLLVYPRARAPFPRTRAMALVIDGERTTGEDVRMSTTTGTPCRRARRAPAAAARRARGAPFPPSGR